MKILLNVWFELFKNFSESKLVVKCFIKLVLECFTKKTEKNTSVEKLHFHLA